MVAYVYQQWRDICGHGHGGQVTTIPNTTYDYIIVGAGSAGSVVAARLSEDPEVTVLLLEAGGEETGSPFLHIPAGAFMPASTSRYWDYKHTKQTGFGKGRNNGMDIPAVGRVLGGSSTVNYMQYARGCQHDYDSWRDNGCEGWGYEHVLPYFLKSEDFQSDRESKVHSKGGFLAVTENGGRPAAETFLKAGRELGYKTGDHNEHDIIFSNFYSTTRNGIRSDPARELLRPAMRRTNLHVAVNSLVTKVIFDERKAIGVDLVRDNRKNRVYVNKEVIVSAGALGSPQLLLLSGIGPKDDLKKLNIPVVADLQVGKNLQYHLILPIWTDTNVSYTESIDTSKFSLDFLRYLLLRNGPMASLFFEAVAFIRTTNRMDGAPDIQINLNPTKMDSKMVLGTADSAAISEGQGLTFLIFLLHPESYGSVKLRTRDPFDLPIIDPRLLSNKEDTRVLVEGVRFVEKLMNTSAFRRLNASVNINKIPACELEVFDSDAYWACFVSYAAFLSAHPTGTCKMGASSSPSTVVDPELRVKGVLGLRIADTSVMPSAVSGNTNAPAIMIGERAADFIKRAYQV